MRLLHAGHADGGAGLVTGEQQARARGNPRTPVGQLLPLHRLSSHHRCRGEHGAGADGAIDMSSIRANPETLSVLDRPNSYIGKTVPRPNLERLLQGRATYVSDMELPRMAHVAFLRS